MMDCAVVAFGYSTNLELQQTWSRMLHGKNSLCMRQSMLVSDTKYVNDPSGENAVQHSGSGRSK